MTLSLAFALIGLAVTAVVAFREHAAVVSRRRTLLDNCAPLLENDKITHGDDGFPKLEGRHRRRFIRIELIPDTMTVRRLPQLWLKLTCIEARPHQPEFSVLARPSGAEFYSLTSAHPIMLAPPPGLAAEIIAKGNCAASQLALELVGASAAKIIQ
ncbi:MAG: hypothetical protein QM780_13245 [Hyphomicrobium sp.]|uniref:hypothetical protein n=1 Tax=Hyphomicrobium sp. TaxID=82 RepID=UPI0039E63AC8